MNYRAEGGIAVCLHFFGWAMLCRERVKHRAIIRAIPEYFVWSEMEQERYRLSVPKEQDFLIRQAVLRSLFGIEVDREEGLNEVNEGVRR